MLIGLTAALASPLSDQITMLAAPAIEHGAIGAVAIGVVRRGELEFVGLGRLNSGKAPSARDRFELGSVSKGFNGLLLADAVRRGEVALTDPVTKYLPWKLPPTLTLRHLATHTSGWPRMPAGLELDPIDPYAAIDLVALQKAAEQTAFVDEPGASYSYSNLGAAVLGAALAKAGGASWSSLVRDRLIQPLALKETSIDAGALVQGHDADGLEVGNWRLNAFEPAGGVEGSVRDLQLLIVASQTAGHPMQAVFSEAFRARTDLGPTGAIGLGWHRTPEGTVWHNGETAGFHSLVAMHPERMIGVVVLADTATPLVDSLGFSILELMAGQNVAPLEVEAVVPLHLDSLKPHVGRYGPWTVALVGDALVLSAEKSRNLRLYPHSPTRFSARATPVSVTFEGAGMVVTEGGKTTTHPKGVRTPGVTP